MDTGQLKVNQLVEIEIEGVAGKEAFPSRVEEVSRQGVHLAAPMRQGTLIPVREREQVVVYFFHDQDIYSFTGEVIARKLGPVPVLVVSCPREVTRIQRRNWVRLEISLPVSFQSLEAGSTNTGRGSTIDMSGGGVLLATKADWLKAGERLWLGLEIPKQELFACVSRVVRVTPPGECTGFGYRVACQFEDIREGQRDQVIRFIFEKQRERIQKGIR